MERLRSGKRRDQIGVGAGGDQILQGIEDHFESFSFCPERWESTGIYAEEDMIWTAPWGEQTGGMLGGSEEMS